MDEMKEKCEAHGSFQWEHGVKHQKAIQDAK